MMLARVKLFTFSFLSLMMLLGCGAVRPIKKANHKLMKMANEYSLDGKEEFVLGEFQDTPYKIFLGNFQETEIIVYVVNKETSNAAQEFVLKPNHTATIFAADFQTVIIQNQSSEEVKLKIGFDKEVEGFRYQDLHQYALGD